MPFRPPVDGHVLIVDADEVSRVDALGRLQEAGCTVFSAPSYETGLHLFVRGLDITVVIVDHSAVGSSIGNVARTLRTVRPNVTVVGSGEPDARALFAEAGVRHYLAKPWTLAELLSILDRRIELCVGCGIELPLRLPRPNEAARNYACSVCGARYYAVLDEDWRPEARSNARLDEPDRA